MANSQEENLREAILEAQAEAALGGHDDLESFEQMDSLKRGYQARCRLCSATTWVGEEGLR